MTSIASRRVRRATAILVTVGVALLGTATLGAGTAHASRRIDSRATGVGDEQRTTLHHAALRPGLDALARQGLVVRPVSDGGLPVYDAPGAHAPSQVFAAVDELGSPLGFLTVGHVRGWFQVLLPSRPNGSSAWVRAKSVTVRIPNVRVEISLAAHELRVVQVADGAVLLTSAVGIGAPRTPTPTGTFFVRDLVRVTGPAGPYGPYAYGLSGHSDVLSRFGSGDARIAIHGTNAPSSIGADASNGCIHLPNDVDTELVQHLTVGTPVVIT